MVTFVKAGPAERAARKKMLEGWITKNPEVSAPLVARLEAGEITEEDLWQHARQHVERAAWTKRTEALIAKGDAEVQRVAPALIDQVKAGEISKEEFQWLLGIDEGNKRRG